MSIPLLADGFESAFMGMAVRAGPDSSDFPVAAYDVEKCVKVLMTRDGMTMEEAHEFIEFNVTTAWVGEGTPVFITGMSLDKFQEMADELQGDEDE